MVCLEENNKKLQVPTGIRLNNTNFEWIFWNYKYLLLLD